MTDSRTGRNYLDFVLFFFIDKLLRKASRKKLSEADLQQCPRDFTFVFNAHFVFDKKNWDPRPAFVLIKEFMNLFAPAWALLSLLVFVQAFLQRYIFEGLINYFADATESLWWGVAIIVTFVTGLLLTTIATAFALGLNYGNVQQVICKLRVLALVKVFMQPPKLITIGDVMSFGVLLPNVTLFLQSVYQVCTGISLMCAILIFLGVTYGWSIAVVGGLWISLFGCSFIALGRLRALTEIRMAQQKALLIW
jgi:hypothetical protein